MIKLIPTVVSAVILLANLIASPGSDEKTLPPAAAIQVDYSTHIAPILAKNCTKCHGPDRQKSSLRLDSREAVLKGGEIGKAVEVGKSAESPLIRYVGGLDEEIVMPPTGDPLTAEQVGLLRAWIDQGLQWSEVKAEAAVVKKMELATFETETDLVTSVAYSPKGNWIASVGGRTLPFNPGVVKIWEASTGKEVARLEGHTSTVWAVAFNADGKTLATGSYDKIVKLWDLEAGKERATLQGHQNWVTAVAFSPDGSTLATGSEDTTVRLWDAASGAEKAILQGHTGTVRSLAFSPEGRILASGSQDGTVKLWDLSAAKEQATLQGHTDGVFSIAFAPGGGTLASGSADRTAIVWDLAGKALATFKGHSNWVTAVAFSPDGRTLASGGYDHIVKLWDIEAGAARKTLEGHGSAIWSVAFSPDGKTLASGSQDGTVKLWDAAPRRVATF